MGKRSRLNEPLPWYRWNPTKWQGSRKVQHMTWAERGLYRELMDECWLKGWVPSGAEGIADLLGTTPEDVAPLLPQILRCFDLQGDGTMTSPFIEEVRSEADAYRLVQAQRRLGKDKHGHPKPTVDQPGEPRITPDNRGEGEQNRTEQNNTPLPPKGGRRRSRQEIVLEFTPEAREVVNTLLPLWHKTQPKDGKPISQDVAMAGARVQDLLTKPGLTPDVLVEAAKLYLATPKQAYRAMQFFFGPGTADDPNPWRPYAMRAYSKAQPTPHAPPPAPLEPLPMETPA